MQRDGQLPPPDGRDGSHDRTPQPDGEETHRQGEGRRAGGMEDPPHLRRLIVQRDRDGFYGYR